MDGSSAANFAGSTASAYPNCTIPVPDAAAHRVATYVCNQSARAGLETVADMTAARTTASDIELDKRSDDVATAVLLMIHLANGAVARARD